MRWTHSFFLSGCSFFLILLLGCQAQKTYSETAAANNSATNAAKPGIEHPDQSTGRIYGRVVYEGNVPKPQKVLVVKDVEVCGKIDHYDERLKIGKHNGIQNAVVSLTGVKNGKPLDAMGAEFVMVQSVCSYQPHVLLAPVNTPVRFLNNDGIFHNIHTFGKKNRPVNFAHPKHKKKVEMVFKRPEKVQVKCDVHGWMSAWIVVVAHPYYAVTDTEGRFTLDGIPSGTYTVTCWQELLGQQTAQVSIDAGAHETLYFKYHLKE